MSKFINYFCTNLNKITMGVNTNKLIIDPNGVSVANDRIVYENKQLRWNMLDEYGYNIHASTYRDIIIDSALDVLSTELEDIILNVTLFVPNKVTGNLIYVIYYKGYLEIKGMKFKMDLDTIDDFMVKYATDNDLEIPPFYMLK